MYVSILEKVFDGGIFRNQVIELLKNIKIQDSSENIALFIMLPILLRSNNGIHFTWNQYEREIAELKAEMNINNIDLEISYIPMLFSHFYLKPFLLFYFLLITTPLLSIRIIKRKISVIHCRSYLPTLISCLLKKIFPIHVIFDLRGLYVSEMVTVNMLKNDSLSYNIWSKIERYLLELSDQIIILSDTFAEYFESKKIDVKEKTKLIYANVNIPYFQSERGEKVEYKKKLELEKYNIFLYSGSLGHWHSSDALLSVFKKIAFQISNPILVVLTQYRRDLILDSARKYGIDEKLLMIKYCKPEEMLEYLLAADFGIIPLTEEQLGDDFYWVARTMLSSKAEEYMAAGLPILFNQQIGGLQYINERTHVGIPFTFSDEINIRVNHYHTLSKNCKDYANRNFSVKSNAEKYMQLYKVN
ncbi:glycosyltransferase [Paenibacillus sp. WC2504]|uniref:glycosyltransferase n=1 Tax=Paenibacillus sp. WC2504 TaxID=3461403 RepID=UPI0040462E19